MDESAKSLLLQNRAALAKDIRSSYIMDHMISDGVITSQEEETVKNKATQLERATQLIKIILSKDNRAFVSFYNALLHEGYKDLAALLKEASSIDLIKSGKVSSNGITSYGIGFGNLQMTLILSESRRCPEACSNVKTALCEGAVPQRPVVFVSRRKMVKDIQDSFYRLITEPGWVVVYGMAGCGKSLLAAEALRDHSVLKDHWDPQGLREDGAHTVLQVYGAEGRPYVDKMKWDKAEMLYWLQQERRKTFMEIKLKENTGVKLEPINGETIKV